MNTLFASIIILTHTLLPSGFCAGTKLDGVMTYSQWLHENALDLDSQHQILADGTHSLAENQARLAQAKYEKYLFQAKAVKAGQKAKCKNGISANWN